MAAISDNIRDMLNAVKAEKRHLSYRLSVLDQREATLIAWLREEAPAQSQLTMDDDSRSPLSAFLRIQLGDGKPHSMEELSLAAMQNGLVEDGKSPRRSVNFTLQSLANAGLAKSTENGWVTVRR